MTFVSHAQNMEDIMLWRALKDIDQGFYIDVGANDPDIDSVTKAFYEQGWRGINLEPVSQWFEKLQSERPRDINLQIAAGAAQGELQFYEIPDTGLSTADKAIAERHEAEHDYKKIKRTVPVETLAEVCKTYHCSPIHFLKIDVEGSEKQVLEGIDFSKTRPWIIVIESTLPNTQIEDFEDWEPILLYADYEYVYFDGLNRYYIASERQNLKKSFDVPPNVFDGFVFNGGGTSSFQLQQTHNKAEARSLLHQQNEMKEQLEKLQNELTLSQANNESLTTELAATSDSLVHSEKTLAEQHAQIQTLRSQSDASNASREQLAAELALTKANRESLANELRAKSEALAHSEKTLIEQHAQIQTLSSESETHHTRSEQLVAELALAKTNNENLTSELAAKSDALARSENTLAELQSHSQWLENEWNEAKAKVEELNRSSHHWWSVADGLNHEMQRVYRSKSWRLTWPLRKLMLLFKWLFSLPVDLVIWLSRLPKRTTRWAAVKTIRYVLQRPGIKAIALKKLNSRPVFKAKLRQFAIARGLINPTQSMQQGASEMSTVKLEPEPKPETGAAAFSNGVFAQEEDLSQLTTGAANTYKELTLALSKQQ